MPASSKKAKAGKADTRGLKSDLQKPRGPAKARKIVQKDLAGQLIALDPNRVNKERKTTERDVFKSAHYRVTVPLTAYDLFKDWNVVKKSKWLKGRMKCISEGTTGKDFDDEYKLLFTAIFGGA